MFKNFIGNPQIMSVSVRTFLSPPIDPGLMNVLVDVLCRYHAERAITIITKLFPEDHLLLASSKRVKGKGVVLDTYLVCASISEDEKQRADLVFVHFFQH